MGRAGGRCWSTGTGLSTTIFYLKLSEKSLNETGMAKNVHENKWKNNAKVTL
jgi:hypothetical protein